MRLYVYDNVSRRKRRTYTAHTQIQVQVYSNTEHYTEPQTHADNKRFVEMFNLWSFLHLRKGTTFGTDSV